MISAVEIGEGEKSLDGFSYYEAVYTKKYKFVTWNYFLPSSHFNIVKLTLVQICEELMIGADNGGTHVEESSWIWNANCLDECTLFSTKDVNIVDKQVDYNPPANSS